MEFKKLNEYIKLYEGGIRGNELKSIIQKDATDTWLRKGGIGYIEAYTGFGKMHLVIPLIKRFRLKYQSNIIVLVPSSKLKEEFVNIGKELQLENYYVYTLNSYTLSEEEDIVRECELLIVDELHRVCNDMSDFFKQSIPKTRYKFGLGLSATLSESNKEFLSIYKWNESFSINLLEARRLELVPDYKVLNVGIELTLDEQAKYYECDNTIKSLFKLFDIGQYNSYQLMIGCGLAKGILHKVEKKIGDLTTIEELETNRWCTIVAEANEIFKDLPDNKKISKIKSYAIVLREALTERDKIIKESVNKHQAVLNIINTINKRNLEAERKDYSIIFTSNIDKCNAFQKESGLTALAYHSKIPAGRRKNILSSYSRGEFYNLLTVSSLDEGFSMKKLSLAINEGFNSVVRKAKQRTGRILRIDEDNPDKEPLLIYLYCKPFTLVDEGEEIEIKTSDFKKLYNLQKDEIDVEYINLEKCLLILQER
jgi:superfamily II DNA or RNA helicase